MSRVDPTELMQVEIDGKDVARDFFFRFYDFLDSEPENFVLVPTPEEHPEPLSYCADVLTVNFCLSYVSQLSKQEDEILDKAVNIVEGMSREDISKTLKFIMSQALVISYTTAKARMEKGSNCCSPDEAIEQVLVMQEHVSDSLPTEEFHDAVFKYIAEDMMPRVRGVFMHQPEVLADDNAIRNICHHACKDFTGLVGDVVEKYTDYITNPSEFLN